MSKTFHSNRDWRTGLVRYVPAFIVCFFPAAPSCGVSCAEGCAKVTGAREMVPAALLSRRFAYNDNPLRGGAEGSLDDIVSLVFVVK